KVQKAASDTIKDIEENGDNAVRDLSVKCDNWSAESVLLTQERIAQIVGCVDETIKNEIKFAQDQLRYFAEQQEESLHEIEVENIPGATLGHKIMPVNSAGCYIPGGRYPMVASAHMSILTAKVAGVKRIVACTPPINGEIPAATVTAMYLA